MLKEVFCVKEQRGSVLKEGFCVEEQRGSVLKNKGVEQRSHCPLSSLRLPLITYGVA